MSDISHRVDLPPSQFFFSEQISTFCLFQFFFPDSCSPAVKQTLHNHATQHRAINYNLILLCLLRVLLKVQAFTVAMTIALLLCTLKYGDARPQLSPVPSMSVGNGSVTCGAIEAQILSQTPLLVANSCTTKIMAVRVCNTLVVHHECKKKSSLFTADDCSLRLQLLKTAYLPCGFYYQLLRHKSIKTKSRKMIIFLLIMDITLKSFG